MKAYVINLDRNPDRMQAFKASFDALGIPYERVAGIDGKAISEEEFTVFKSTRPRPAAYPWKRGQMGCFSGHYAVWTKIANSNERYGAIFEDDIYVSDTLKRFLAVDTWIPENSDIIRLEISTNRLWLSKRPVSSWQGRSVFRVRSTSWCAASYILSRDAARRLIALPHDDHHSVDHMLFSHEDSRIARELHTLQVIPALCIQDKFYHKNVEDIIFKSEIGAGDVFRFRAKLRYARKTSPLTFLRRFVRGYKRIRFAP